MIDQSFSARNFRRIYDLDRKNKGTLEVEYFPDAYKIRKKITMLKGFIYWLARRLRSGQISTAKFEEKKVKLMNILSLEKNNIIMK